MRSIRSMIARAATFRILTELVRRHHTHLSLRILELHPNNGMYDCLTLWRDIADGPFPGTSVAFFNTASENIGVSNPIEPPRATLRDLSESGTQNYVEPFLQDSTRTLEVLEALCGLPVRSSKQLPPSTPAVAVYRILSELLERAAMSRRQLDVRSGWFDSSGYDGCFVREELAVFPAAKAAFEERPGGEKNAAEAARFWLISTRDAFGTNGFEVKAAIDLSGCVWAPHRADAVVNTWQRYEHDRTIGPIVTEIEAML